MDVCALCSVHKQLEVNVLYNVHASLLIAAVDFEADIVG